MKIVDLRSYILSDLYRIYGFVSVKVLVKELMFGEGFVFAFWFRICSYLRTKPLAIRAFLYPIAKFFMRRQKYRLGISISDRVRIGSGLYIGHFGGIVVNERCIIGSNCNISHGVTLGQTNRGDRIGAPILGDNVYIGPGAKIIGEIRIGDNAAIGANCVVVHNVPDNGVVVGIPGRIVSYKGSYGYVNRTDYQKCPP